MSEFNYAPRLVDPQGKPVSAKKPSMACPRCGAGPDKRTLSAGFGQPHDVCTQCGHDFDERTL